MTNATEEPMALNRRALILAAGGAGLAAASGTALGAPAADAGDLPQKTVWYGADEPDVPKVGLRWAFSATVFFPDRVMIDSPVPRGFTSIGHGEVWGPRLQGRVLPHSGADYYKGSFNTDYMFEASDGDLIYIHNRGTMAVFEEPPQPGKPLVRMPMAPGRARRPGWVRFRATPVFEAPDGPHGWMNETVFVAYCQRVEKPDHTVFTYFEVV